MSKVKKLMVVGIAVLAITAVSLSALAASVYGSPAEVAAGVTGKTQEEVMNERKETGKTYGRIAKEADVLDEFKTESLKMKKDFLSEQVAEGNMTQEEADEILTTILKNQENCNGDGSAQTGKSNNARFGSKGSGRGDGSGEGLKQGRNSNVGNGQGNRSRRSA